MIYTQKIKDAINFATKTHEVYQKQKRKGKDIPYITHPLVVGLILARAGASEDVIVAGILHDTIEDSPPEKKVTPEMLAERFGEEVADLVNSVTEPNKELPWEERKQEAFEHVERLQNDSLLVKSADLISNISEIIADYQVEGDATFKRFNAPKTNIIRHYMRMVAAVVEKWPENPLIDDLRSLDIMSMDPDKYSLGMNGALWRASHKGEPMVFVSTAGKTTEQIVKEGLDQSYKAGFLKKGSGQMAGISSDVRFVALEGDIFRLSIKDGKGFAEIFDKSSAAFRKADSFTGEDSMEAAPISPDNLPPEVKAAAGI